MGYRVIGLITLQDHSAFEEYRSQVGATIAQYGGKVLQRAAVDRIFYNETGACLPDSLVDIDFPSAEDAQRWADSPEYGHLLEVRGRAMRLLLIGFQGA
jgi:uncharacterized protein (DUF1330 family)